MDNPIQYNPNPGIRPSLWRLMGFSSDAANKAKRFRRPNHILAAIFRARGNPHRPMTEPPFPPLAGLFLLIVSVSVVSQMAYRKPPN
ncbi:hypothetical protein SUGI_1181960 [Cryptomeria japonica]|nr:hypothetical protein SUGI_1181960 [Cryptomeria japonica]